MDPNQLIWNGNWKEGDDGFGMLFYSAFTCWMSRQLSDYPQSYPRFQGANKGK